MSSLYKRGNSLWVAFKDERGIRVCRPTGYKVGDEAAARAMVAELDRKADAQPTVRPGPAASMPQPAPGSMLLAAPSAGSNVAVDASGERGAPAPAASTSQSVEQRVYERRSAYPARSAPRQRGDQERAMDQGAASPEASAMALTVREYGERWLKTREQIESFTDECGRLRNHVFPRIGDMRMRDVRPRHIRDFILDLKQSNAHRRGTAQGFSAEKIAPRTVRHVYGLMRRMFGAAVIDEVIDASPVVVAKGVLPKNVDKDPAWRATALYDRDELVRLMSEPAIPPDRRMLNAIKGLAGTRHGEAAGLRWQHYLAETKPLGKLIVARSYDKDGTKTKAARLVPVHPVLAQLLDDWHRAGWAALYGRSPRRDDYIVPRAIGEDESGGEASGEMWQADEAFKLFLADLEALGMRRRRGHDLRRTFITLAQEDGARRDVLQVITHAPNASDVMGLYTTYPWPTLCAEVAKLRIALPEPRAAHSVVTPAAVADSAPSPSASPDAARSTVTGAASAIPSGLHALLEAMPTAATTRRTEARPVGPDCQERSQAPVTVETDGADKYFGGAAVARPGSCSATVVATCSADSPVIPSRWPGMIRRPTVYETTGFGLPETYRTISSGTSPSETLAFHVS